MQLLVHQPLFMYYVKIVSPSLRHKVTSKWLNEKKIILHAMTRCARYKKIVSRKGTVKICRAYIGVPFKKIPVIIETSIPTGLL